MATQSWSSTTNNTNDAQFQAWGSALSNALDNLGFVPKTADTGQVDWGAGPARPAANTRLYEVRILDDAFFGVAPIYFRIEYGSAGTQNNPAIAVGVGTGSNGSGTLTGGILTVALLLANLPGSASAVQQIASAGEGWFAFSWGNEDTSGGTGLGCQFGIHRTCDVDGVPTPKATLVRTSNGTVGVQFSVVHLHASSTNIGPPDNGADGCPLGLNAFNRASTVVGGDTEAFSAWIPTPEVQPLFSIVGRARDETAYASTFTATPVGVTPRTYIRGRIMGGVFGSLSANAINGQVICFLWE